MLVLYRFSTYPEVPDLNWSLVLNLGPRDYESPALTTELMARIDVTCNIPQNSTFGQDDEVTAQ